MEIIIQPSAEAASSYVARYLAAQINNRPNIVLGLATGGTPEPVYAELIQMYEAGQVDFSRVTTFNLDEYVGLSADHSQSYRYYMRSHLFDRVNIPLENTHFPDGMTDDIPRECRRYEQAIAAAGGIDLQLLGIGRDGHIGFNEPTSSLSSRTRIKTLTEETLRDNARYFESEEHVPYHVLTMGIGTIRNSRCILLLAHGASKAEAIAASVEGPLSAMVPASALQLNEQVIFVVDEAAASKLSRRDYYKWVFENKPAWQQVV
ncbi:MAG: glucosamine-6-phosphate deaminase [Spartobacteria bacterium]|nr:glucosamine-6-phosphate deaminase [Spartobacteria bacterium]